MVCLVVRAEFPHALVVAVGKGGPPGLAQPGDHRHGWAAQAAPGKLSGGAVLEQAKQPELLPARAGQPDLVRSAYWSATYMVG